MKIRSLLLAGAAAMMVGASHAMPPMGRRYTPTFVSAPKYNGDGKKVKAKKHPRHNSRRPYDRGEWQRFREAVLSTHRYKPDGSWNVDPRDDKYLHSHARAMRGLVRAIDARDAMRAA